MNVALPVHISSCFLSLNHYTDAALGAEARRGRTSTKTGLGHGGPSLSHGQVHLLRDSSACPSPSPVRCQALYVHSLTKSPARKLFGRCSSHVGDEGLGSGEWRVRNTLSVKLQSECRASWSQNCICLPWLLSVASYKYLSPKPERA